MSGWLRAGIVARLWGVKRSTVATWAEAGLIRAHRTRGGQWRIAPGQSKPLRMSEAAARLGVSRRTALRRAQSGEIAARKVGERWYWTDANGLCRMQKLAGK